LSPPPYFSIDNMTTPHVDDAFLLHLLAISPPTNLPLYPVRVRDQTFTVMIDSGASDNYVSRRVVPWDLLFRRSNKNQSYYAPEPSIQTLINTSSIKVEMSCLPPRMKKCQKMWKLVSVKHKIEYKSKNVFEMDNWIKISRLL
jgi:hypothetical protein